MKYKCKDCGKIYEDYKPEYCECGNDEFSKIRTKSDRYEENDYRPYENHPEEKKENPLVILLFLVGAGAMVWWIMNQIWSQQTNVADRNDEYLTSVRQEMLKDFDPSGIRYSGYCIISFKITEDGRIIEKRMLKQSPVRELNDKVMGMLYMSDKTTPPPAGYRNVPIKIEFGCMANEREVECYSKNIVDKT